MLVRLSHLVPMLKRADSYSDILADFDRKAQGNSARNFGTPAVDAAREPKVDDIASSIGANVNQPFAPAAPSVVGASQMPQAQAPTTPYKQQEPTGTGVSASTVPTGPTQPGWTTGRLGGAGYQPHAALPGMDHNRFPTMGGRSFYQSDLGQPTGVETMNPAGAQQGWYGYGANAEEAGRNLTANNTRNMHTIALGQGGVQADTQGGSQFFNNQGAVTGEKRVNPSTGAATLDSQYGGGSATFSPTGRRGIDYSRGSITENGKPWKPATGPETPQGFAGRMAQNAPEVIPKPTAAPPTTAAASAIRKPISEISQPSPGGRWVPPSNRQPATT